MNDAVQTTPEEFEHEDFTLKTHQMFSVHTTPKECKNAPVTGCLGFVPEKNAVREITWLSWPITPSFSKSYVFVTD